MDYEKPYKSVQEQIQLLRARGLIIDDNAEHYLRHLNYYRLSGYWLPFEQNHSLHKFKLNTHFNDVLNLYIFDREFRLLILNAIERIEVSVRTHWAHDCAKVYGAHAYLDGKISKNQHWHQKNMSILKEEIDRSHERFIKHYKEKYHFPKSPPIWAICEVMSLGLLSRYLKNLKPSAVCTKIAKSYQLDYGVLTSYIEHLAYLRNLCAHHSRVWNRNFTKTMRIPTSKPKHLISSFNQESHGLRKVYNSLVMLFHLLDIVSPNHHVKSNLIQLIDKHSISITSMGFPTDWKKRGIWIAL